LTFLCSSCEGYEGTGSSAFLLVADFEEDPNTTLLRNTYAHAWYRSANTRHGGSYSFASAAITHNMESRFDVRTDEMPSRTGTLKFWVACSTESYWDKMKIYRNNQLMV
jgi:hypothetical protein